MGLWTRESNMQNILESHSHSCVPIGYRFHPSLSLKGQCYNHHYESTVPETALEDRRIQHLALVWQVEALRPKENRTAKGATLR